MSEIATQVRGLRRETELRIDDPDVGEVTVIIPEPRESENIAPGVEQLVFTHSSGRMIGLNWIAPDNDTEWDEATLVIDEDGFHHVLLVRPDGDVHLLTRREPGMPEDWENRGTVSDLTILEEAESAVET